MRYASAVLIVIAVLIGSCSKEITAPTQPPTATDSLEIFRKMSDSCSYTIDGQVFTCKSSFGFGKGNARVNYDTFHLRWSMDSTQYFINYTLGNYDGSNTSNNAYFKIYFVKNFKNSDMYDGPLPVVKWPRVAEELKMYAVGQHPYTIDFERFNSQDGIALSVRGANNSGWASYITASSRTPTTIPASAQANSVFEVTRLQKLSSNDYDYLLEARFSANVYGTNEVSKKLSGYLRLHVTDY